MPQDYLKELMKKTKQARMKNPINKNLGRISRS